MLLTLLQTRDAPPPPPASAEGYGPGFGQRRKQREFDDERRAQEALRKLIERALDPITATAAKVVATDDGVAVLPSSGSAVALPIPPAFSVADVTRTVMQVLATAGVEAERVRSERARVAARESIALMMREQYARVIRRRREEEWLLLMD